MDVPEFSLFYLVECLVTLLFSTQRLPSISTQPCVRPTQATDLKYITRHDLVLETCI